MGYIQHNAIIVTSNDREKINEARTEAIRLGLQATNIYIAPFNGYTSFFIAPDGCKSRWPERDLADKARLEFRNFLRTLRDKDGYNVLEWVEVTYGNDPYFFEGTRPAIVANG